ncbi:MAG TPA: lipopolysaccharide assembly protein LapA domain-containing protein [Casimicrobiaceae bacterium]|nr:lipopolysaccharide assembly protein LapA domain-containing protein [Casimicrobiaceae bacterium]
MSLLRWIVGGILFVALLFLSLQNSDLATVRFYHWFSWQAPLIFLLLAAFAAGVAAGLLASLVRSARLKRQLAHLRKELRRAGEASRPSTTDDR